MVEQFDCVTFKRDCGAEPQSVEHRPELFKHQQECNPCQDYYQGMLALDAKLNMAFNLPVDSSFVAPQETEFSADATVIRYGARSIGVN